MASGEFRPDAPRGQHHGQAADFSDSGSEKHGPSESGGSEASGSEAATAPAGRSPTPEAEVEQVEVVEPSEAGDWEAPAVGASPLTPRSPSWASARVSTEDGVEDALSERDLFLAWGDDGPPSEGRVVLHREAKPPSPRRAGLPAGALSQREAMQVWTLLQAAAATPKR